MRGKDRGGPPARGGRAGSGAGPRAAGSGGPRGASGSHPAPKPSAKTSLEAPRRWFLVVPPGLEHIALAELNEVAGIEGEQKPGGVSFRAGLLAGAALVDRLRVPTRLLLELSHGPVHTYDELAIWVRKLPLAPFLHPTAPLEVHATCEGSRLRFHEIAERKVTAAAAEAIKGPRVPEWEQRYRLTQRLQLRIEEDQATLSIDAGGELLHRRGWRTSVGEAPLRENLAAALLQMAGWDGQEALVDPFCGSGTILVEAGLWASGRSSFTRTDFACREWPALVKQKWSRPAAKAGVPTLCGSDRNPAALIAARDNAERAGVAVRWSRLDVREVEAPASTGLILSNPPYGERLEQAEPAYRGLGELLRGPFAGWRLLILTPEPRLARLVHPAIRCLTTFSNGGLKVGAWALGD